MKRTAAARPTRVRAGPCAAPFRRRVSANGLRPVALVRGGFKGPPRVLFPRHSLTTSGLPPLWRRRLVFLRPAVPASSSDRSTLISYRCPRWNPMLSVSTRSSRASSFCPDPTVAWKIRTSWRFAGSVTSVARRTTVVVFGSDRERPRSADARSRPCSGQCCVRSVAGWPRVPPRKGNRRAGRAGCPRTAPALGTAAMPRRRPLNLRALAPPRRPRTRRPRTRTPPPSPLPAALPYLDSRKPLPESLRLAAVRQAFGLPLCAIMGTVSGVPPAGKAGLAAQFVNEQGWLERARVSRYRGCPAAGQHPACRQSFCRGSTCPIDPLSFARGPSAPPVSFSF